MCHPLTRRGRESEAGDVPGNMIAADPNLMTDRPPLIDLHSHSTASDGQYPAEGVAERASAAGLAVWSLTDHDSVASLAAARAEAGRRGVRFVAGIELSVHLDRREIHVLGHYVDPESAPLR